MFWDTQVMATAAKVAETHVGPMGRFAEISDKRFYDVRFYTHQAGIFWYGDVDWPAEKSKLEALAKELKEVVFIVPQLADGGSSRRSIHKQAIAQVTP